MQRWYSLMFIAGIALLGPSTSQSSSARSQSYKPGQVRIQSDQPEISEVEADISVNVVQSQQSQQQPQPNAVVVHMTGPKSADPASSTKPPYAAIGQYSKSVLVNTQSASHSYIYDPDMPIFDLDHSANVTALLDKTAVLNCRVRNIGNKTVSWVRHRDIHLLTVGRFSYTSDQRFTARHADESEDWLLKIHYLQKRDAGWYGCQISTTPPVSHMVHLSVVEPETAIHGGPDVYINSGSRLALTCSVKYSPEPPAFIFWYHNDRLVSYDRTPGGVQVQIEKGPVSTSRLLVQLASMQHSGKYTCAPSNSSPKSVTVHVLAGEKPAAIQHENNSATAGSPFLPTSYRLHTAVSSLSLLALTSTLYH